MLKYPYMACAYKHLTPHHRQLGNEVVGAP